MAKEMTGYPSIDRPWLKYYSKEAIDALLPEETLYEYVKKCNSDNMNRIAINYYGKKITYRSFFRDIDEVASALEQSGVKEGDMVSVIMINSPETISLMFGLNKIGAISNMIYGADTPAEIKRHILDANSKIIFILSIFLEKIQIIKDDIGLQKVVVIDVLQGMSALNKIGARILKGMKPISIPKENPYLSWKQFIKLGNGESKTTHSPDLPAFITYTGGTTGGSKGVLLSNKAVLAVAYQYILGEKELYRDSKWAQVLPLFIAYGVTCSLMIPLIIGMTLVVRIPMSDSIAEICRKFKPNHIMYGPAFWEAFADDNKDLDLSYLIAPITGGDTLPDNIEKKVNSYLKRCGSPYLLMNGYGMTEVGAAVSVNYRHAYEEGSVGAPFVKDIVSAFDVETGKELTYGEEGEICIHAPSMMNEYLNNPEETRNIIRKHDDGLFWVHSGDYGYISENGFIHICGRLKRYMLSIANGVQKKVFSLDVERGLMKHPAIEKCAVVPINDEKINQAPFAYIVLKSKDDKMKTKIKEDLKRFAEKELDPMYRPVDYQLVSKFPLTKVGKVDYHKLEEMASQINAETI